ncbi:hypothetical protein NLU14_00050 [Marinobacter sp. 71-i]|uniref:Uncharacterized protein n=1 Tax=Marinobacter iranensis TaxID=2962607 RepID=A0ABT5Y4K9_9GAMM|nr:hypothetical protein [Marinobacter iranensis]MDF0748611.1 hypothetical protein [Marinobacter iranensis]
MRFPLRLQASALLLAMVMPLAQAAEDDSEATVESLRQEVQRLDQELTDFTAERRERLMTDIGDVLGAIDARVTTLENRLQGNWDEADKLARAQAQTALASLHRERVRVTEWHQRMQDSADFTWESMKEGFNEAFDKLSEAWQNAEQSVGQALEEN